MKPDEFAAYRTRSAWRARVAAAHTLVRELLAEEAYRFDARRFASFQVPTLILAGGDSPAFLRQSCELAAAALPGSRIVTMPGQRHIAMDTAPELFVREVLAFLLGPG
jgi:pimeloyl-ACP methyl ester carboxylesterase